MYVNKVFILHTYAYYVGSSRGSLVYSRIYMAKFYVGLTVGSERFLYNVAPPELKISPLMYFVIHNSVVLSKILKIVVPF